MALVVKKKKKKKLTEQGRRPEALNILLLMQETWVRSLGWEDPLEEEMEPAPIFLPLKFHGQRSLGAAKSWTGLSMHPQGTTYDTVSLLTGLHMLLHPHCLAWSLPNMYPCQQSMLNEWVTCKSE